MEAGPTDPGSSLRVSMVQRASSLDPAENRAALEVVGDLASSDPRPDLVVLPEAFARDFGPPDSSLAPYAEDLDGPFGTRLAELAATHDVAVLAGMFERSEDPERPWNTLVLAQPGRRDHYRKIHLYDSFGYRESDRLSAGPTSPVVVDVAGFRVGLMTCYDLRFPELARALVDAGAEVLVVPAAWVAGDRKVEHWRTLARARAIENIVFVVAVGQPGPRYTGHSMAVSPLGDVLGEVGDDDEGGATLTVDLRRDDLDAAREQNPSLTNRRL
ncbi:MAG: carbon-nitrogen hydrolase family protein [Nocardioides sp.]|nr:carbon-nitrogen hydrolase family protein [Nocardioides sp.]